MILNFCYDSTLNKFNPLDILPSLDTLGVDIKFNIYDMSYTKEQKKGRVVMNKYAARYLPFIELTDDDGNMLYVSYGEVNKAPTREQLTEQINKYI